MRRITVAAVGFCLCVALSGGFAMAQSNIAVGLVSATFPTSNVPYTLNNPNGTQCLTATAGPSFAYNGKPTYPCQQQIGSLTYGQCGVRFFNAQPSSEGGSLFTIAATLVSTNSDGSWCAAVATNSLGSNIPYVGVSSCAPCVRVADPVAEVQSQALVWNRTPMALSVTALFPNGTVCATATDGAVAPDLQMTLLSCVGPQMGSLVFKSQSGNCTATIQSSDVSSPFASTFVAGTAADGSGMCVLGTFASLDYSVGASFTCPPCTAL